MKELFLMQKKYNERIYGKPGTELTPSELEKITQELALCAHSEISALIEATRFKKHHNNSILNDRSKILYESVDIIRYAMAIINVWDIEHDSFLSAFKKKDIYLNVRKRIDDNPWKGEPVVIVDIDDVLANFRNCFVMWLSTNKNINPDIESSEYYFIDALKEAGRKSRANF